MTPNADGPGLLNPVAAAIRLGATPELLFHYAAHATRTVHGSFRLPGQTVGGSTLFSPTELDAFDVRLSEPRSHPGGSRVDCNAAVTAHLRVEAGGCCARCGGGVRVQNAHVDPYHLSQSNHHRNVIRLCSQCHGKYDDRIIPRSEIESLKRSLIERTRERLLAGSGVVVAELPTRAILHGRNRELAELATALRFARSVVVRGVGGIGKTQLVLNAAHIVETGRPLVWMAFEECSSEALLYAYLAAVAARVGAGEPLATLSGVRACLVLDGIERAGCGLVAVARLIERLVAEAHDVQVVVTTQARLPEIDFDVDLLLSGLDHAASAMLLPREVPEDELPGLLELGDGHPLTLRILAALVRHLGGASVVIDRVRARPELPVELPGRTAQDPGSSLDRCLQVALSTLDDPERIALWVLAQLPAGVATAMVAPEDLGIEDSVVTLAALGRWHLIENEPFLGDRLITMLSPVRDFVRRALATSPPHELDKVRAGLACCMSVVVNYLNDGLIHAGRVRLGMRLLDRELPNLLAILDLSRARSVREPRFRLFVTVLACNLQTYFFSSGRFEAGAEVMRAAADLAIAAGSSFEALELLSQLQSLAGRAKRYDLAQLALDDARSLEIGDDPQSHAVLLGMEAHVPSRSGGDWSTYGRDATATALEAAKRSFELLVEASGGKMTHRAALALLQQACLLSDAHRPGEALALLDRALGYFRVAEDPINAGAALQRRGNCLADLKRPDEAMRSYAESAVLFHELEAAEYRSNALGEAGLVLAEYYETTCPLEIGPEIILGGINDVVDRTVADLAGVPVPGNDWPYYLTRKICGTIVLASLAGDAGCMARMAARLDFEVAAPLMARETDESREVGGSLVTRHFGVLAWFCVQLAGLPGGSRRITLVEVELLAVLIEDVFRSDLRDLMFGWLARYLSERHGLRGLEPGELRAAVDGLAYDEPFALDRFDLR